MINAVLRSNDRVRRVSRHTMTRSEKEGGVELKKMSLNLMVILISRDYVRSE